MFDLQLAEDVGDVELDGADADGEPVANLSIAEVLAEQPNTSRSRRVRSMSPTWPPAPAVDADSALGALPPCQPGLRRNARASAIASSCGKASPDTQAAAKVSSSKWARTAVAVVWRSSSSVGRGGAPMARRIVAALPRNHAACIGLPRNRCEVRHALQALGHPQPRAELIVQRQRVSIMERRDHI